MQCKEIIQVIEATFPRTAALGFDNVGLLAGRSEKEVSRIYLALDATDVVIDRAIKEGADMLITHHPLLFSAVKKVTDEDFITRRIVKLIQNDISYYAMHTNYDVAKMAELAEHALHLTNCTPLEVTGVDADGNAYGIGSVGELPERMSAKACCAYVKEAFGLTHVQLFGEPDTDVKRMAVCPGSGGKELMEEALKSGADIYLTGDVGHHTGLDAQDQGLTVIDAGHFGIEKIYIAQVMALLRQHFPELLVEAVYQEPFVTL